MSKSSKLIDSIRKSGDLGDWFELLEKDLNQPWFAELMKKVGESYKAEGNKVAPAPNQIFRAFRLCPPSLTRVIMVGQDPYPQPYVADGLAFSTLQLQRPVSQINLVYVVRKWIGHNKRSFDDLFYWNELSQWEKRGVLLLNTALTVRWNDVGSHQEMWKEFIKTVMVRTNDKLWVLMGRDAQSLRSHIKSGKVLTCVHPAARANKFRECDIFTEINQELQVPINWGIWKEEVLQAGLYAGDTLLAKIPGCFYIHPDTSKEIKRLLNKKVSEIAFLEQDAQAHLKRKIQPEWMDSQDMHEFYHNVLIAAMQLDDDTIINQFKLLQ